MSESGDELYGDAVYEHASIGDEQAEAEVLDDDRLGEDPLDGDPLDRRMRLRSERFATTPAEEREGESLDERLAEEEPDLGADAEWTDEERPEDFDGERPRTGQLVAPDEGTGPDVEKDAVAREGHIDTGTYEAGFDSATAAEEAAIHITDDPEFH